MIKNPFNGYECDCHNNPQDYNAPDAKVVRFDGSTPVLCDPPKNPISHELTADAFDIKSLIAAGVPIKQVAFGKIPATPEQKLNSVMNFAEANREQVMAALSKSPTDNPQLEKVAETVSTPVQTELNLKTE